MAPHGERPENRLETLFGPPGGHAWRARRDNVARFLGHGRPDITRVLDCAAERATLFGYGDLQQDLEDVFAIPLPPSLEGATIVRRLTLTVAWLSPVSPRHQQYRAAALEIVPGGDEHYSLAVKRIGSQPTADAIGRGTAWHATYEGDEAMAFLDGGQLVFRVTCRSQVGPLDEPVPYAIAVSVETAIGSGIPIYNEVRAAIQAAIAPQA